MLQFTLGFISLFLTIIVLFVAKSILVPLVLAVFIWYLINALAKAYGKLLPKCSKKCLAASIITFVVLFWLPARFISSTIPQVIEAAPSYQVNIMKLADKAMVFLDISELPELTDLVSKINFGKIIAVSAQGVADFTGYTFMVFIYLVFLLLEQGTFYRKLNAMFPEKRRQAKINRVIEHIYRRIQTYLSIKTFTSVVTGVLSYFIMYFVGLDFAAFWALLIFFLNFIPNIGSFVATILPALLALIQFDDFQPFVIILSGVFGLQFIVGNVVEPRLMGKSLNLSPLIILLSLVIWGNIWGISGMFLCVPITVIIMIIMAEFPKTRPFAVLLSSDSDVEHISS